jgi:hypothetical protein
LGWTEIAVVWVEDDEITAKAYALADNRTADLGTYDDQLLADMILAVQQEDEQLLAMSGWDDQAVQDLLYIIETGGQMPNVPGSDDQDGAGHAVDLNEKYEVVVECSSEQEQEALLLRLSSEGLKVRAIIV